MQVPRRPVATGSEPVPTLALLLAVLGVSSKVSDLDRVLGCDSTLVNESLLSALNRSGMSHAALAAWVFFGSGPRCGYAVLAVYLEPRE